MKRSFRIGLMAAAAVVVLAAGAGTVALLTFDPNAYKPDIIAAVKRATGRDLVLNGRIGLKLSLAPTLQIADVAFSNPPGFSRPQMATLQGLELEVALLPLVTGRLQIDRLVLVKPDILLETNAQGQSNWQFNPQVSPEAPAGSQAPLPPGSPPGKSKPPAAVSIDSLRVEDGRLAWRDDRTGRSATLGVPRLDASAASPEAPLHLVMAGTYDRTGFNLTADTGSLVRLQDPAATSPWPVKLEVNTQGARLAADGTLAQPMLGKGYDLSVSGAVADMTTLAPFLTGFRVPPLKDVHFSLHAADKGAPRPDISNLTMHVGGSDLGAYAPGLVLEALDIKAAGADQPVQVNGSARLGDAPLSVAASVGAPALLMPHAKPAPYPVDVSVSAAGARLTAKGSIADAQALTGANIALAAEVPDLAALSPLVRQPLPSLHQVSFNATLTDAGQGLRNGVALHGLTLASPDADLAGDATFVAKPRPSMVAALKSTHIDLDALAKGFPKAEPPPAQPAPDAHAAPVPKPEKRLFSDRPLPFRVLRQADADITFDVATLHASGADAHALAIHAGLKGGKLTIDRFGGDMPGGHMSGTLSADATQAAPPVHLTLHAPGLALKTLLALAHEPPIAAGNLEVYADLSGAGETPHAIAASLDGHLGLAVAGGTIDNRVLGSVLGRVLQAVNALDLVGRGGTSDLRCFAARMQTHNGEGTMQPLALSSSLLTMAGGGAVNLGNETMGLSLKPEMRLAATTLVVPIRVTGPILAPVVAVDKVGAAESNAGTVAGAVVGNATPIGILGGLLGADKALGIGGGGDMCPAVLAAARGQGEQTQGAKASAAPAQTAPPSPAGKAETGVKDIGSALKSLLR